MWDPPGLRIGPMSPALAGEFFTTEPPQKPCLSSLNIIFFVPKTGLVIDLLIGMF